MQDWIIAAVNQFGYIGIALLIAIENIFPPIPSEVILTFGGFMTTVSGMKAPGVVLAATVGSVIGAILLYSVGRWLNPQRLARWVDGRMGRMLRLKKSDLERAQSWFSRRGRFTVFFCRFIPVVRSLISIPAGMTKMNLGAFLFLTTLGTLLWNVVLVYLGVIFGGSWETVLSYFEIYSTAAIVALLVVLAVFAALFYRKRLRRRAQADKTDQMP